ncbi:MAG: alpha-amylase family glycosyl hydrolase [Treponema sp.]|nr:alpha-amylase family glycosyl hydrolase [Treponema sp.]
MTLSYNEFHISREIRDLCNFDNGLFASSGNVVFANLKNVRTFQEKLNTLFDQRGMSEKRVSAGSLNAMGLIDEIFHHVCMLYRKNKAPDFMTELVSEIETAIGKDAYTDLLMEFMEEFPPVEVYQGKRSSEEYLADVALDPATETERPNRQQVTEEMIMLLLANENPAFKPFKILFDDTKLAANSSYGKAWAVIKAFAKTQPVYGPFDHDLITLLKEPVAFAPDDLKGQLDYIQKHWKTFMSEWLKRILTGMDTISEEQKASWQPIGGGAPWDGPDMAPPSYEDLMHEYERYSPDKEWMPKVVLMAKTVLVWLDQLTKKYGYPIDTLDKIPDCELDTLRDEGFTGLWLIGLWERSKASKRIKQICGNPEAAASAYSLFDYNIAENIGGWSAVENLRARLWARGIRLASDMVPNHTGMDGDWVMNKPDLFVQRKDCPFPHYTFNGENLSHDPRTSVYLEDHYYSKNDCSVVFKRVDNQTGDVRYIYHGNDGTGLPWNDTAQIDFLNPQAREEVMQEILHVARNFPIIRFDAAMVLAKKHIRRLWYPEPGHGGDIATRSETGLSTEQFNDAIPNEFWREVVDRVAQEVPDTLLLAEAFWMMEGYFVRTLGMHRVYNSAFMNMLKKEENQKYRDTVKNTIAFDPQVLKRYVNFMNNPDEETAVAQFGKGDKYFGVCTLMITMPGLPMFGHGQIEGYEEKYGMEYTKAYKNETPDQWLIDRHWQDIFPLMKKRYLFANVENFLFYSLWNNNVVNENVFAYSNRTGNEQAIVFYNNKYERACGWIKQSEPYAVKTGSGENDIMQMTRSISEGLGLTAEDDKFVIFREHHSGLWFIRSSKDICDHGMYVELNGFETQVYLDVQQITDEADGRYRTLCAFLNGKGCEDIETAWQELMYKDLYQKLDAFAGKTLPELYEKLKLSNVAKEFEAAEKAAAEKEKQEAEEEFSLTPFETKKALKSKEKAEKKTEEKPIDKKEIEELVEASLEPAKDFYNFANYYVGDAKPFDAKKCAKEYAARVKKLTKLLVEEEKASKAAAKEKAKKPSKATSEAAFDLQKALLKEKDFAGFVKLVKDKSKEDLYTLLLCYAFASSFADTDFGTTWALPRKFNDLLKAAQKSQIEKLKAENPEKEIHISVKDYRQNLTKLFVLTAKADLKAYAKDEKKGLYPLVSEMINSKNAWLLSGANDFDNIRWFNKESSDEALSLVASALLLSATTAKEETIFAMYKTLCTAKAKAEYKAENFIKPFAPSVKISKKAPAKKVPAKKEKTVKAETKTKTSEKKEKKDSVKKSSKK